MIPKKSAFSCAAVLFSTTWSIGGRFIELISTHLWLRLPLKSCIEIMAKTRTVTRHRKHMLVIAGMIYINIWTSLAISGKEVSVRRVLRPLTALRAEIELSPPMKIVTHDRLTIEKSMMFHPSRRYEYGYRTKPNAKILRRHSTVYMIWKVYSRRSKIGDLSGQCGFGSTAICTQLATIVNMMNCSNHLARRMLCNLERKGAVAPQVIPQN